MKPRRTATALFERCASAGSPAAAAPSRGWLSRQPEPQSSAPQGVSVDVESYIVNVSDYNPAVPSNVFLAAGGPGKSEIVSFTTEQQRIAADNLQHSLASLAVYDVFVDTDGDLSFSDYTRIALLSSSGLIIVPSEASFTDYNRLLTFCEVRRVPPKSCWRRRCVVYCRCESRSEADLVCITIPTLHMSRRSSSCCILRQDQGPGC